jgi:predicted RNase H-related nuclease YkuK (DUF458 family)
MLYSQTYGNVSLEQSLEKILEFYEKNKNFHTPFHIVVGTDSQNFDYTKVVTVVTAYAEGHGGIFFSEIEKIDLITSVRQKLNYETQKSLKYADEIINILENNPKYEELFIESTFTIHVDASYNDKGKTKDLIPALTGWIKACGYDYEVKPDSYAASSIADKISK